MTGHECWMAEPSEIVYSILMMQNNFVAPNINLDEHDEYAAPLNIARKTIDMPLDIILSNSFPDSAEPTAPSLSARSKTNVLPLAPHFR